MEFNRLWADESLSVTIEALSQVKVGAERVEQVASKLKAFNPQGRVNKAKSIGTLQLRGAAPSQGRIETLLRPPTLQLLVDLPSPPCQLMLTH